MIVIINIIIIVIIIVIIVISIIITRLVHDEFLWLIPILCSRFSFQLVDTHFLYQSLHSILLASNRSSPSYFLWGCPFHNRRFSNCGTRTLEYSYNFRAYASGFQVSIWRTKNERNTEIEYI